MGFKPHSIRRKGFQYPPRHAPGLLVALHVKQGDKVEVGQPLAVIEAMKMENILRAGKAGTVKSVSAAQGESLPVDAVILELE